MIYGECVQAANGGGCTVAAEEEEEEEEDSKSHFLFLHVSCVVTRTADWRFPCLRATVCSRVSLNAPECDARGEQVCGRLMHD